MKKIMRCVLFCLCFILVLPAFFFVACDFNIDYKTTSDKLVSAIGTIKTSERFVEGGIEVSLFPSESNRDIKIVYNTKFVPKLNFGAGNAKSFEEVNDYYNTIFAFSMNYIYENMFILSTKPSLKTLNERQENLYENLDKTINAFSGEIESFEREIDKINQYYANKEAYGASSEEVYFLNFKKAYRNFISKTLELSYAIDNLTADVYSDINYLEYKFKDGEVFKSLEGGICAKVFEGYFEFLIDTFDCRVPTLNIDANETMQEIVNLYESVQNEYKNIFRKYVAHTSSNAKAKIEEVMEDTSLNLTSAEIDYLYELKTSYGLKANMTSDEILEARNAAEKYFEEMHLYKKAYGQIGFVSFYFDYDCDLENYIAKDTANRNRYNKIKDYLLNILPRFDSFIATTFFG